MQLKKPFVFIVSVKTVKILTYLFCWQVDLFIVDAALIFEANFAHFFDSTLLIIASEKTRIERAEHRKNLPLENIQNRILLQMSDKQKKEIADSIINNNGKIENFHKKIDVFYNSLRLF